MGRPIKGRLLVAVDEGGASSSDTSGLDTGLYFGDGYAGCLMATVLSVPLAPVVDEDGGTSDSAGNGIKDGDRVLISAGSGVHLPSVGANVYLIKDLDVYLVYGK